MVDQHRAKDNIGKTADVFLLTKIVDKEFTQASTVGQTPSIKIDAGNDRLRVGVLHSALTIQFRLCIDALRIWLILFRIKAFLCAIEDRVSGEVDKVYVSSCTGSC